jgi:hypothetical protein
MDEGVVEGCQNVADSEHILGLFTSANNWGSVVGYLFFLSSTFFAFSTFSCCCLSFLLSL